MKKLESVAYFTIAKMVEDGKIDVRSIEEACKGKPWAKTHTMINKHRRVLEEEKIISNTIEIDFERLGYGTTVLVIKTENRKARERLANYLEKNIHVYRIVRGQGAFDLVAIVHLKGLITEAAFVDSIESFPGISKIEPITVVSTEDYTAQRFLQMTESTTEE